MLRWIRISLAAALCAIVVVAGAADAPPDRWINASDVNLRGDPGGRGAVLALLPIGAPVRLAGADERNAFCEIESAGTRGFVPCRFLSAAAPTRADAASAGVSSGARWVTGTGVNLRAEPSPESPVLTRLALNARVELLATVADSAYCEVAAGVDGATSVHGYTACRYLASAPLAVGRIVAPTLPDGTPNPEYDPVRSFWLAPSWAGLEAYATQLGAALKARSGVPATQPTPSARPSDAELERMKAHLAKGIYGAMPPAPIRWDEVVRLARTMPPRRSIASPGGREFIDQAQLDAQTRLASVLALVGPEFDLGNGPGAARLAGLVDALVLPPAAPSFFRSFTDVAPPGASVEELSGRFHVVATYRTRGRDLGEGNGTVDGVWDIGQVTVALTQPVTYTTIFRDGRLQTRSVRPSETRIVWGLDPPECEGYLHGFAFGAADPRIWRFFGPDFQPEPEVLKRNPPGTLVSFATRTAPPIASAPPVVASQKLDRDRTGFVAGTWMHFDLDGDGVVDLAVWEGTGKGPGHLDGPTTTDDPYYRLFFANIGGRWHVLGTDQFGYGCGC